MEPGTGREQGVPGRKIRVLVLIKGLGLGGAERLVVDLAAHRDRERFDYEAAYVLADQAMLAPALAATGVAVHDLGATRSVDLRWVPRLRRLLDRGRFDVLHAHLPYAASFGRIVARSLPARRRPALVYTEHSLWNKAAVLTKALNRATVGFDDAMIVVSSAARDALPRRLRARAEVVVHGVDRERSGELLERRCAIRRDIRAELGLDDGVVLALTVANVRQEKGYDVLLRAARVVADRGVAVRFVSVGGGPLEDQVRAERDAAGLADRVMLLGRRADALRLMAGADIFVLPSRQEGMPVALMEAMSVGLPVVASEVGGVPDIVVSGVEGLLVPPDRPDLLADAVIDVSTDPALRVRLGQAALAKSASFDVSGSAQNIEALYLRLMAGGTR